jgi:hypothetical protein
MKSQVIVNKLNHVNFEEHKAIIKISNEDAKLSFNEDIYAYFIDILP